MDSNHGSASATDLQSVPFGHLGTYPNLKRTIAPAVNIRSSLFLSSLGNLKGREIKRADERNRTPDHRFTKPVLYQLSYIGKIKNT